MTKKTDQTIITACLKINCLVHDNNLRFYEVNYNRRGIKYSVIFYNISKEENKIVYNICTLVIKWI